jgi:hypothetical protein
MAGALICEFGCIDECIGACSDPDDLDDADRDEYADCGLMADGQCTKVGSEECDWECGALRAEAS